MPSARLARAALPALAVGAAAAVGWAVPRTPLPEPAGPHAVGTVTLVLPGRRPLPVQVWYPAVPGGTGAPLVPDPPGFARAVASRFPVPEAPLRLAGRLRGHAVSAAPLRLPVRRSVLLVHGWMGFRTIHADIAEHLASAGDLVVAADHVGGSLAAQFPGGQTMPLDSALLPPQGTPGYWDRAAELVARYAEDLAGVLDGWPAILAPLGLSAPAEEVRVIGHSTGGGAALALAAEDARVAGIVGLDPWVEPLPLAAWHPRVPTVAVRSQAWVGNRNDRLLEQMGLLGLDVVPGARHTDFTALSHLSPVLRLVGLVRADPTVVLGHTLAALSQVERALARQPGVDSAAE